MQVQQQQERILERDAQLQRLQADLSELQLEQHAHQQSAAKIAALQKQVDIHLESTAKYLSLVASAKLANEASAASIHSLQSSHTQTKDLVDTLTYTAPATTPRYGISAHTLQVLIQFFFHTVHIYDLIIYIYISYRELM